MRVKKAVIPAAGLGTRMLPFTKSIPKEMLPVGNKPAIHHIVEEIVKTGINDILIITARGKRAIEDYFDENLELELYLREREKLDKYYNLIKDIEVDVYYIRQKKPLGLGDAIRYAEKHVNDEPFLVCLGDDIIVSDIPASKQIIELYEKFNCQVLGLEIVDWKEVGKYGIIKGSKISDDIYQIVDLIEKPSPERAPSNIAVIGRYVLNPEVFEYIRKVKPDKKGEIQLTDALALMIRDGIGIKGKITKGKRYDVGTFEGWLKANMELGIKDEAQDKSAKQ